MLFVSYVPLLTDVKGLIWPPEEKDNLMQMLTEASQSYRIEMVAWALEDYHSKTRPYPVLIVPFARDICEHLLEWSGHKPEQYFTLVWRSNGQGYDLVLVPNFEKSVRRYHLITGDSRTLTILGHMFLYQAGESQLDLKALEDRSKIRLGWATKVLPDGNLEDYAEINVRCKNYSELPKDEQEHLNKYWQSVC